ncbi:hypothetical protein QZH56_13030 [Streptomyces olivoreticuli]|uniref:hypothetical protein n=1 Tax=Streptomyces olivoreticuli TaxID=68246 RepID=UPI002658DD8F|nr:hypothetical protein [Streptomyces olivoreticuli]WKK27794.1 hypothetical protein QZH56_13030 [Streptomyces olivoreticuli]
MDIRKEKVGQVMGHEGPRLQLRPPAGGKEWEVEPDAVRLATAAERIGIGPGSMVIDTVTGGTGRVTAVDGNGMISIQHPNGHAWRSCTVRPADRVERLNLLAADAVAAQRTIQWSDGQD